MIAAKEASASLQQFLSSVVGRLRKDSLFRNSIFMMATSVLSAGAGYIFWVVAARTFSPHDVGQASALIQIMLLASMISNPGIHSTLVQVLPHRAPGHAWSLTINAGMVTGVVTGLFAGSVLALVLPLMSHQFAIVGQAPYALALIVGVPLWTVSLLLDQTFVAERLSGYMFVRQAMFSALRILLLVALLLLIRTSAISIVSSWVLAAVVSALWGALLFIPRLSRAYRPAFRGIGAQVRSLLSSFTGHHLINLGGSLRVYLLPALVAARISATDYAYFYTAWMLGTVFSLISPAVAITLFAEGAHTGADIGRKARSAALLTGMFLAPAMLATLIGGRFVLSSFGPNYAERGIVLVVFLVASAVPDALTNLYVSVLRVRRRLIHAAALNLGMAAVTLTLAWFLLPTLGIAGAGVAWFVGQVSGTVAVGVYMLVGALKTRDAPGTREEARTVRGQA